VIERLKITDSTVSIQSRQEGRSIEQTYEAPSGEEELTAQGDTAKSDTSLEAGVEGYTEPDTVEARVSGQTTERGFWDKMESRLAWIGGLVVLLIVGFFTKRFLP
jgi:hypothetical protein